MIGLSFFALGIRCIVVVIIVVIGRIQQTRSQLFPFVFGHVWIVLLQNPTPLAQQLLQRHPLLTIVFLIVLVMPYLLRLSIQQHLQKGCMPLGLHVMKQGKRLVTILIQRIFLPIGLQMNAASYLIQDVEMLDPHLIQRPQQSILFCVGIGIFPTPFSHACILALFKCLPYVLDSLFYRGKGPLWRLNRQTKNTINLCQQRGGILLFLFCRCPMSANDMVTHVPTDVHSHGSDILGFKVHHMTTFSINCRPLGIQHICVFQQMLASVKMLSFDALLSLFDGSRQPRMSHGVLIIFLLAFLHGIIQHLQVGAKNTHQVVFQTDEKL